MVYRNPDGWLAHEDDGEGQLIHRVIGTPGDTIVCCDADGRISVNGEPLDEPYLAPDDAACNAAIIVGRTPPDSPLRGPCDWSIGPIPDGKLFVMGDDRGFAADSRFHLCPPDADPCDGGPRVPIDLVRGVVELPDDIGTARRAP